MSNFKLLAIRPLKGCNRRFLKNLTAGEIYPLYNSYTFYNENKDPVIGVSDDISFISSEIKMPLTLYNKTTADGHMLQVNISAVAGKNGSGKSSLLELLFASVYLLSVNHNILTPNIKSLKEDIEKLESESDFKERDATLLQQRRNIIAHLKTKDKKVEIGYFEQLNEQIISYNARKEQLKKRKVFISNEIRRSKKKQQGILSFGKQLQAEIYFELDSVFYGLILKYDKATGQQIAAIEQIRRLNDNINIIPGLNKVPVTKADLAKHFFYTIAINYSHYALNSMYLGDWINALFHKNDGYTTPMVINPMRTEGGFNINSEINFARYRLLTNVLQENVNSKETNHRVYITENHFISKVKLTLNRPKVNALPKLVKFRSPKSTGDLRAQNLLTTLLADYLDMTEQVLLYSLNFPLKDIIVNYILNKVDIIPEKYPWFGLGYQFNENTPSIENEKFFNLLKEDGSHITYKLKQAINFLKYNLNANDEGLFLVKKGQIENNTNIQFKFTLAELMDWMGNPKGADMMQYLPPSIFDIDFELSNDVGSKSLFNELSSGEQQLVHTVQSVIYHLNNLQSVHMGSNGRAKYQAVNIVYDEIELYFHPEYQRRFIANLLTAFGKLYLNGNNRIKAINILLLTHSPFILSDIPRENIMLLELHKKTKRSVPVKPASETFAANINDLLADGFFLKSTLMGEFAENEIKSVIGKIKKGAETEEDRKLLEMVGDSFLRNSLQNFLKTPR